MGAINSQMLEALTHLLREGRVQEADNQLVAAIEGLKQAELAAQMSKPATEPPTDEELLLAFYGETCALLGNPPRLFSLLVEIRGRAEKSDA